MAKSKKKAAGKEGKIKQGIEFGTEVWLAGLGAFVKAQEEGSKLFESLVKEGEAMQARSKKLAKKSQEVTVKATETWDKLEHAFEDRLSRASSHLGVVTHKDMEELTKRIEQLEKSVKKLTEPSKPKISKRTPTSKQSDVVSSTH